jgi:hypothetical protein
MKVELNKWNSIPSRVECCSLRYHNHTVGWGEGGGGASFFYPSNTSGSLLGGSVPSFPAFTVDITKEQSYLHFIQAAMAW